MSFNGLNILGRACLYLGKQYTVKAASVHPEGGFMLVITNDSETHSVFHKNVVLLN